MLPVNGKWVTHRHTFSEAILAKNMQIIFHEISMQSGLIRDCHEIYTFVHEISWASAMSCVSMTVLLVVWLPFKSADKHLLKLLR